MSYLRRWGARVSHHAQWMAHVGAFGPEPERRATWRCRKCGRRWPVEKARCCK